MSSGWELYVAAKLSINFKHLKVVSTFLILLEEKTASYKLLKEIRSYTNVVGLVYVSSNLKIIILRFRT